MLALVDEGYYLRVCVCVFVEILLCKWSGVCVCGGGGGVFVLVDILREREREFERETERESESNMGGCSGRLRYLKKENPELMNKLLTIKKDGREGENDGEGRI